MVKIDLKKIFIVLSTLAAFLLVASLAIAGQYHVLRVIDGDTIDLDDLKKKVTVRLVGIDAPELGKGKYDSSQPFARVAENHLTGLVGNRIVDLKAFGTDRYGRMLAEVFVDNKNVNIEMLKAGLAEVYRGDYPAPGLNLKPYWQAEEEARKARLGMWSQSQYMSPREWRRLH